MPRLPPLLAATGTDEYRMPEPGPRELAARARVGERAEPRAARLALPVARYLATRTGTAATLRALDAAAGGGFYDLPAEAEQDPEAAEEALRSDCTVVDVQTHYVASDRTRTRGMDNVLAFIEQVAPERFAELDRRVSLGFAEYLRCLFLESETAAAVLTAAPGDRSDNILPNEEIAATRAILERCAGGRLLHHAIVHPERESVGEIVERHRPAGLKVYTLAGSGWRLDDEAVGLPFLSEARASGADLVCAHKGFSMLAPTGSPADVGPAAQAFPDIRFLVYHAGYEAPADEAAEERAYDPAGGGVNRLLASLAAAGIGPGGNVWAELGSTWACLLRRPLEAAHVLGKLLAALGPDRIVWGTDSLWYGPAQPLIDAFRAFRIPERLREQHGYPELTAETKAKILGGNAASVYGIDLAAAGRAAADDDLAWMGEALREARGRGLFDD